MRIVEQANGAWLLIAVIDGEPTEVARRSTETEMRDHLNKLSAARAVQERDGDGSLVEHRATVPREATAQARSNSTWGWQHPRGAVRRRDTEVTTKRKTDPWGD